MHDSMNDEAFGRLTGSAERCEREEEILDAIATGRLAPFSDAPIAADELRAHLAGCPACSELLTVAGALNADRSELMSSARLPGSGLMWWRASMRARQEAARAAMRMARVVQALLIVTAFVVAAALLGPRIALLHLEAIAGSIRSASAGLALPLMAVLAWLILAPMALYLTISEE